MPARGKGELVRSRSTRRSWVALLGPPLEKVCRRKCGCLLSSKTACTSSAAGMISMRCLG